MYKNTIIVCCKQSLLWSLKFAQSAKIDDKKFRSHERKSASSYFPNNTIHWVSWKFISTREWTFVNRLLCSSTLPAVKQTHPQGRYILWAILSFSYQEGKNLEIYLTQCMLFDYRLGKHGLPYKLKVTIFHESWSELLCIKLIHKNLICINGTERLMISKGHSCTSLYNETISLMWSDQDFWIEEYL